MGRFFVMGDLYNGLFVHQISNPEVLVDYQIWNRIVAALPEDYVLADEEFLTAFQYHSLG